MNAYDEIKNNSRMATQAIGNSPIIIAAVSMVFVIGCGRQGPELVPVVGRVTLQGKPVVPGAIFLEPIDDEIRASSLLQLDGTFKLRSYPYGDGAVPGDYKVYIQLGAGAGPKTAKFTRVETSPLKITIPETGLDDYQIELSDDTVVKKK